MAQWRDRTLDWSGAEGSVGGVLYGRALESARLDALFADAAAGRGGVVVVRGEPGVGKSALTRYISRHRQADLDTLRQLTGTGQVTPLIGRAYPLTDVPEAIRDLQDGHARGKIAITI